MTSKNELLFLSDKKFKDFLYKNESFPDKLFPCRESFKYFLKEIDNQKIILEKDLKSRLECINKLFSDEVILIEKDFFIELINISKSPEDIKILLKLNKLYQSPDSNGLSFNKGEKHGGKSTPGVKGEFSENDVNKALQSAAIIYGNMGKTGRFHTASTKEREYLGITTISYQANFIFNADPSSKKNIYHKEVNIHINATSLKNDKAESKTYEWDINGIKLSTKKS